jgi:hypothetical protein
VQGVAERCPELRFRIEAIVEDGCQPVRASLVQHVGNSFSRDGSVTPGQELQHIKGRLQLNPWVVWCRRRLVSLLHIVLEGGFFDFHSEIFAQEFGAALSSSEGFASRVGCLGVEHEYGEPSRIRPVCVRREGPVR